MRANVVIRPPQHLVEDRALSVAAAQLLQLPHHRLQLPDHLVKPPLRVRVDATHEMQHQSARRGVPMLGQSPQPVHEALHPHRITGRRQHHRGVHGIQPIVRTCDV